MGIVSTVNGRADPGPVGGKNANLAPGLGRGRGGSGSLGGGSGGSGGGITGAGAGNGWGGVFGGIPFGGIIGGGGIFSPSVVCSDPGPCYQKRLTCPQSCFKAAGNWGPKGGGGGCTMDCKHKCRAYC